MNTAKVMPVDLAMHTSLNRHPPVQHLLGMSTHRSHYDFPRMSTCDTLELRALRSPQAPVSLVSAQRCKSPSGIFKKKKRVVFADAKGLALCAVWIFNSDPPISETDEVQHSPPVRLKAESSVQKEKPCLRSRFKSVSEPQVHLESCSLICGSVFGKVRVCNTSPKKAVYVHITYDSWRSHQDIPCTPIQQEYEGSETELFVFNFPVVSGPNVQDHLEFCVSFRPGTDNTILWDTNGGQNYRILVKDLNSEDVHLVKKKTMMPQNSQSPQSLRNGPALYTSFENNTSKTLRRQENGIQKRVFPPNSKSAYKLIPYG
ncbi:protein phosphatase 1 regulatory subunit 3C-like [Clarias gariepinus]|uniref:protein phosphatase 1 regulatory subunit 3C-like n=1 Tax=Clarias gariepinus TaxID=13013 RepID=UPI00234E3718|nr:protein phosphatase 1 regulatory subunit 3C-like [Clarias gariepinus]